MTSRSNEQRSAATKGALLDAARQLFLEKSYAGTNTPEIARAAGVTRGALYHHFEDKRDLFRGVLEREAERVGNEIENSTPSTSSATKALELGGKAFLDAMATPGRTRLLLIDGPAVLGRAELDAIDGRHGNRTLRDGLAAAIAAGELPKIPLDALTLLVGAMFDRAAMAIETGMDRRKCVRALRAVLRGLGREPASF